MDEIIIKEVKMMIKDFEEIKGITERNIEKLTEIHKILSSLISLFEQRESQRSQNSKEGNKK
jgi:hypothetical protein